MSVTVEKPTSETETLHHNGLAAKDPEDTHEPCWMVAREATYGGSPSTFGPFESREEAVAFGGLVYCGTCNHQSACGPWL